MKNTDLHSHSYYSDGLMSPKEVVRLAKSRGIKHLALTDHNSVKGVGEAIKEGKRVRVDIVPAVEIEFEMGEILGYFVDIKNKKFLKTLKEIGKRIEAKTKYYCKNLKKEGYNINFNEIWKKYPKARGNINTFYPLYELHLRGYGTTLNISKELERKKIKKLKIKKLSAVEVIKLIKNANGVPVLAHPWIKAEVLNEKYFKTLVNAGLKGIEINNGDRAPFMKMSYLKKIKYYAKKYGLISTSGSDFHGKELVKQMPGNHNLGKNNCDENIVKAIRALAK